MGFEVIKLLVKPNASKNSIDGIYGDRIKVRVSKPPEKGKANKELIRFISEKTGIPVKDMKVTSGLRSNLKEITISKTTSDDLTSRLLKA